jgi:hypothetical protein
LIPADGFYEWRKTAKPKLPFAIAMKDGRPFTFAGLWENWKDPEFGEWLRTCTIITGEPNELVAQIHPRMPVILAEQHHAASAVSFWSFSRRSSTIAWSRAATNLTSAFWYFFRPFFGG